MIHFLYTKIIKPILFSRDPEEIHDRAISLGEQLQKNTITRYITRFFFYYENPKLQQQIKGINFQNPIGLSAGFDKDARIIGSTEDVGFGFTQIGTITLNPYSGNTKPRLKRFPEDKALWVNYGLKNEGADVILERAKNFQRKQIKKSDIAIGVSIGKTNSPTTVNTATGIKDYTECTQKVIESGVGDFYTINISCPNVFGGEPFTKPEDLKLLLESIFSLQIERPVFIKMPINLPVEDFDSLLEIIVESNATGVIIGNLNKKFKNIPNDYQQEGGMSGIPTKELSNELISHTYKKYKDRLVIIGVGGIFGAEDAYEKIKRGASLVQLITGVIFEGPQLMKQINKGLVKQLKKNQYGSISEAVGSYYK